MKIKNDDETFIIPVSSGIHILYENNYKERLISDLSSYFIQKKKTKCLIFDDEDDPIPMKSVNFIYIPQYEDLSAVFEFKPKTMLNSGLSQLIDNNPEMYQTVDQLRSDFRELLTDVGMYRFAKILNKGTDISFRIETSDFDIPRLLQTLGIDTECLTRQQQMIMLYNLQLYINRDKVNICYLDFEVNDEVMLWMENIHTEDTLFLVSNEAIDTEYTNDFETMIILSPYDHLDTIDADISQISLFSYIFHPVVLKHPEYQNEKIFKMMSRFKDSETTFLIDFTADNMFESL